MLPLVSRSSADAPLRLVATTLAAAPRPPASAPPLERLLVRKRRHWLVVHLAEVDWIEGARNYARLHVGGASHLVRRTLSSLEPRLDPDRFARIHRSTIVNLDRIAELRDTRSGRYDVLLLDGTRLSLSRSHRRVLLELAERR